MIHSLKKGSMFNIKTIQSHPPPSLKSIYRNYLKSGILTYKKCNLYIGSYLFKLLQLKRTKLKDEFKRVEEIQEYIKLLEQNKVNPAKPPNSMFKKFASPHLQQTLIRLRVHHEHMVRITHQRMLSGFEHMHLLTGILNQSLNPLNSYDLRIANLTKLIHLAFNISQFFSPTLTPRNKYQSLLILHSLDDDMQFEGLKQDDKEYVRDVIVKVCGRSDTNYAKFRDAIEYLRDHNALHYQKNKVKVEIGKVKKDHKTTEKQGYANEMDDEQFVRVLSEEEEELEKEYTEEWSLLNEVDRNRAVKQILMNKKPYLLKQQQEDKSPKVSPNTLPKRLIPKTLLFQLLETLNLTHSLYTPNFTPPDQLYQICRRLFTLKSEPEDLHQSSQQQTSMDPQMLKLPLLDDIIMQHSFIDEFVNRKRIILV